MHYLINKDRIKRVSELNKIRHSEVRKRRIGQLIRALGMRELPFKDLVSISKVPSGTARKLLAKYPVFQKNEKTKNWLVNIILLCEEGRRVAVDEFKR